MALDLIDNMSQQGLPRNKHALNAAAAACGVAGRLVKFSATEIRTAPRRVSVRHQREKPIPNLVLVPEIRWNAWRTCAVCNRP